MSEPTFQELMADSRTLIERSKEHLAELRKSVAKTRREVGKIEDSWQSILDAGRHHRSDGGKL